MTTVHSIDVLIVGSGPAGLSTALHLVKADPAWAKRMLVIEKDVHPRPKLCGGGVTRLGERVLTQLGFGFEPAHIPINEVRIIYRNYVFAIRDHPVLRPYIDPDLILTAMKTKKFENIVVIQWETAEDLVNDWSVLLERVKRIQAMLSSPN